MPYFNDKFSLISGFWDVKEFIYFLFLLKKSKFFIFQIFLLFFLRFFVIAKNYLLKLLNQLIIIY